MKEVRATHRNKIGIHDRGTIKLDMSVLKVSKRTRFGDWRVI